MLGLLCLLLFMIVGLKTIMPLPYFILGIAAGQFNLILYLKGHYRFLKFLTYIFAILSLICWFILFKYNVVPIFLLLDDQSEKSLNEYRNIRELFDRLLLITSPFIASFYSLLLILCIQNNYFRIFLRSLKFYGKMALTNYIGQTLFVLLFGYFLTSYITPAITFIICLIIVLLQLFISYKWFEKFKYGPLEYVWKFCTYLGRI